MWKGCIIATVAAVTAAIIIAFFIFSKAAVPPEMKPWEKYRLPATLSPQYYNVTLWPRLEMDTNGLYIFTGHSGVAFVCMNKTRWILIHSNKLNYILTPDGHHAMLTGMAGTKAPAIKKTWLQVETQYLVVELSEKLQVGKTYWLFTEFQGELTDSLGGFYRSEYYEDGVKRVVATTQMQPTDARKAFPCFDEPAMKAVFHMTLIHVPGTKALANAMEIGTKLITLNNQTVLQTKFEPTKKMSTYLLAFIVSDFDFIRAPQREKVLIRIWARRKAINSGQGDYSLNITGLLLDFFQYYYNTSYPLHKSDQVALPDFSAGAMENWGLVTYRETTLLYDPEVSSNEDKEDVVIVISHELAHMWFGNLVTMKWWNDVWLNEGFATYVSYLGASEAEPTWSIKDLMVLDVIQPALLVDSQGSSHPLSCLEDAINTPKEISALFNSITYKKGAAVLRMLSEVLSEPVFVKGLIAYLNQFAYGNTVYTDLWGKIGLLENCLNLPATINEIMNRWTLQMGFPVVTIDTQTGRITQKLFLLDPDTQLGRPSSYEYEWFVPIKWMKNGTNMGQYWLLNETDTHLSMKTNNKWVLANLNISGFYRVNYDSQNWQRLLSQLTTDHTAIPIINRAQIIDDAFSLSRAKIISTTVALSTTKYLSKETEYVPWESAVRNLNHFSDMLEQTEVYDAMQNYLRQKVQPLFTYFKKITSDWTQIPSRHTDQYNQINAISLGCKTGVEGCMNLTSMWYNKWMENPSKNLIHPNLKATVYCYAISIGGDAEWEFGWKMYKNATIAAEAKKLMSALSCTRNISFLHPRYLKYTLDPNMIRKQDVAFIMAHAASSVVGRTQAWNFIRANWHHFVKDYDGFYSFGYIMLLVTRRFSTETELNQLQQFRDEIASAGLESTVWTVDQQIERTKANMKWVAENKEQIKKWLTEESA
uniref:Aminopeptidase n=1 Tax=Electrophorus electricus TaxID=8005 RepID=A0A4W4GAF0_ELEEL